MKEIQNKLATPVLSTNIRIVTSAESEAKATAILSDLEASFNQFENVQGNRLEFTRVRKASLKKNWTTLPIENSMTAMIVRFLLRELTTVMHLPVAGKVSTSQVKLTKSGTAPAAQWICRKRAHISARTAIVAAKQKYTPQTKTACAISMS